MENFIIEKMEESTFDDNKALMEYKNHDYKIIGDKKGFILYYEVNALVIWVHFLWALKPIHMYNVLKKFSGNYSLEKHTILFDCDICEGFNALHKNHAKRIYVWTKELK